MAPGWPWGALLVAYFVAAMLLSRLGGAEKARLTGSVVAKGGARDATQVIANGGIFAACLLLATLGPPPFAAALEVAALGALAASSADTWATEIGTLYGGTPRSVRTLRPVPPGTSGAVSAPGSLALLAGALATALAAKALGLPGGVLIVTAAGVAGALADSLLGATLQERRWCPSCKQASERRLHGCGSPTTFAGGREWMDNDLVNLLATVAGAGVAATLASP